MEIALGHHGLAQRFDEENPFVVVVMAQEKRGMEALIERVSGFIDSLGLAEGMRKAIKVNGYPVQTAKELEQAA